MVAKNLLRGLIAITVFLAFSSGIAFAAPYYLTYNKGDYATGGQPTANAGSYTENYSVTVANENILPGLKRTGYSFDGWNSANDGNSDPYTPSHKFAMPNKDLTLYADWDIESYSLTYDANANSYTAAQFTGTLPAGATYEYTSAAAAANALTMTMTGYEFANWDTNADGSGTTYAAGQSFSMTAGNLPLYAQWTVKSYTLTYDANNDGAAYTPTVADPRSYSYYYEVSAADALEMTGYTFKGWGAEAEGKDYSYTAKHTFNMPVPADSKNLTLYAKWDINSYSVTYDANADSYTAAVFTGTLPAGATYDYTSAAATADALTMTMSGYKFKNWNTKADGNGTTYAAPETFSMTAGHLPLYAQWDIESYTLTYNAMADSGKYTTSDGTALPMTTTYNYALSVAAASALEMTGYTFQGWHTDRDGDDKDGTAYAAGKNFSMTAANLLLYAIWKELPTVQITDFDNEDIGKTTAKISGMVTKIGDSNISEYGHVWSTSDKPTINNNKTKLGARTEKAFVYHSELKELKPGTTYYVRAYATNSYGTAYSSDQKEFITDSVSKLPAEGEEIEVHPDRDSKSFTFKLPDDGRSYTLSDIQGFTTSNVGNKYTFKPDSNKFAGKHKVDVSYISSSGKVTRSFYVIVPLMIEPESHRIMLSSSGFAEPQPFTLTGAADDTAYTATLTELDNPQPYTEVKSDKFAANNMATYALDAKAYSVTKNTEYSLVFEVDGFTGKLAPDTVDIKMIKRSGKTQKLTLSSDGKSYSFTEDTALDIILENFAGTNDDADTQKIYEAISKVTIKLDIPKGKKITFKPPKVLADKQQIDSSKSSFSAVTWTIEHDDDFLNDPNAFVLIPVPLNDIDANDIDNTKAVWCKHEGGNWKVITSEGVDAANGVVWVKISDWSSNTVGISDSETTTGTATTGDGGGGCFINSLNAADGKGNIAWIAVSMLLFAVALTAIVRRKQRENS